jgi:uncharacterized protein
MVEWFKLIDKGVIIVAETVLITGASGGLGKALAEVFAEHGFNLVLVARSENKLKTICAGLMNHYGINAEYIVENLSDTTAPQRIYDEVVRRGLHIDQLINNAGSGNMALVGDANMQIMVDTIHLNVTALTLLCNLFVPHMKASGKGKILNVSSLGAFQPDPYFAVYGATKAYGLLFTQSLYGELLGTGVTASVFCPGPIKTNWASNAGKADSKIAKDAGLIARIAYRKMQKGKLVIIPTFLYKTEAFAMRIAPKTLAARIIRKWQSNLISQRKENA